MVQVLDPQRLHPYKHAFAAWQETKSMHLFKDAYLKGKTQPFFSERHFPHAPHIIQADICWQSGTRTPKEFNDNSQKIEFFFNSLATKITNHKRGVLHTEFITSAFMQHVPSIIAQLDAHILGESSSDHDIEIVI
jgi:hypothetical protein